MGEVVLEMVMAAREYQVNLLSHKDRQSFVTPDDAGEIPAVRDWVPETTGLVSVNVARA